MRSVILCVLCILFLLSCSPQQGAHPDNPRIKAVERGLTQFTIPAMMFKPDSAETVKRQTIEERMAYYKVPGVSIAVISDNELDWAKGYGTLKAGTETPVTTESLFQAASTSKLLVSALVLHYVQTGALDLDTDINAYLTSWQMPENQFTRERSITLRLLLTHQAGLPVTNFSTQDNAPYPTLVQVLNGEPPALNKPATPESTPGGPWKYSNLGSLVIQQILEDVTGIPFPDIAEEVIFTPLGMANSTFSYPLLPADRNREALPHDDAGNPGTPAMHLTALAHAGLMTTPSDLALFTIDLMRSYQDGSGTVLSQPSARILFHKELDIDPTLFGVELGEGLGVLLYGRAPHFLFSHPGSNLPGANCWLIGAPETGMAAVVMTNGIMGEILGMEIITAINIAYRWKISHPPTI